MADTEPERIQSFKFYLFAPKTRGWLWRLLMLPAAFVLLVGWSILFDRRPDPNFELSKLRGLTSQQIVAKFGEPTSKRTIDGNLWFVYMPSWSRNLRRSADAVEFKDNHVIDVQDF